VRLIFVSDRIPDELRRIVEFLNEQMSQTEVLAVEIKQYVSQDSSLRTLVPRIIGQTAKAQDSKSGGARSSRQWDEASFFDRLEEVRGQEETTIARALLEWAQRQRIPLRWGQGGTEGSFAPRLEHAGQSHQVFSVFSNGTLEIRFSYMQWKAPFDEEAKRLALRDRLNEVTGFHIQTDQVTNKRPWYYLSVLQDEADLKMFVAALDWFIREVKAT